MNTHQAVSEIARRLPYLRRCDVQEVVDVLTELWAAELTKPEGEIRIAGLGRLYVETHRLKATGVIRQRLLKKFGRNAPLVVLRRSIRFHPYEALQVAIKEREADHE